MCARRDPDAGTLSVGSGIVPHVTTETGERDFDFLHGSWDVRHSFLRERLAGSEDWDHASGRAVCAPILDGAGNLDQIGLPHRDAVGATLRLFDRDAGVWRLHWLASDSPRLEPPMEGSFTQGVGTFFGADHLDGRAIVVRFLWDDIGRRHARWTQAFSLTGTEQWEPNWIMEFTRTSDAADSATTATIELT